MPRVKSSYVLLGVIFVVALFLRFYVLSGFPVGFHIDEASLGYNGYSLLQTGKDENGNAFPLYVDMFGDNRPSGYHYLAMFSVAVFGLTEFATRLPGALVGSFTIIAIFFLTQSIFQNKAVSLLSALFLAITPWHVVLSRASSETIVALFFIILGFALLIRSLRQASMRLAVFSTLILSFSYFFYHTPRVFIPLLFFALIIYVGVNKIVHKRFVYRLIGLFLFLVLLSMLMVFAISGGTGRFSQVNIFSFPETRLVLEEQIREDGVSETPVGVTRLFHNKVVNYSLTYVSNYASYFTAHFLFIDGGLPIWYRVPKVGLIYLVLAPFFAIGTVKLLISRNAFHKIPILWLLLGPAVAAITVDDVPNIQRASVMFPMVEMIAAYGIIGISNIKYQKSKIQIKYLIFALSFLFLLFNFFYFLHQYFVHSKIHKTLYRNNGFKTMIETVKASYEQYDSIIVTKSMGGIYPLVLFYMQFPPNAYQHEGSPKDKDFGGFGKFFFVPDACPSSVQSARYPSGTRNLYVDKGDCPSGGIEIYREDGSVAFRIVRKVYE